MGETGTTAPKTRWKDHDLRLTVAHCLELRGTPSDVPGNPVAVILGLRDPGILIPLVCAMTKKKPDELTEDMDGSDFYDLQQATGEAIKVFFRKDPSFSEFLTKVMELDETERRNSEKEGLVDLARQLRAAWKTETNDETPTGGESSPNPPDEPDLTPATGASGTLSEPTTPDPEPESNTPRKSSPPSTTPTLTANAT